MKFEVAPGTLSALGGVGTDTTDTNVEKVTLSGDLCQMGTMGRKLREAGFTVKNSDVYPVIQGDEIKPALQYLWDNYVEGWWNQEHSFIEHGICTAEEFRSHFKTRG